ncbi:hypothetical protein IQ266_10225 [filamentous cyanobacterium LEGE 11480]|uniref:Outer membrane protein beta-barrel domain-containing protein n=1 Tax=Romeriopsis navalis LEGE 11480 TaxID=2777977 RepID=A0A928VQ66_9CYAN|nr:hypothetical protein [Romeriopsis navalis]MBE9030104.1 hypothetical protein [Romeriopsis navalis LEGE 11480]
MRNQITWDRTVLALLVLPLGAGSSPALAAPAANHIGAGIRTGFQDESAFVLNGKVKVADFGQVSLSGRPTILFNDEAEFRLAITGEGEVAPNWSPYFGGGIAINTDATGDVDPLLTAGIDFLLADQLVLQVGGNLLFKANDTDTELTATANYAF